MTSLWKVNLVVIAVLTGMSHSVLGDCVRQELSVDRRSSSGYPYSYNNCQYMNFVCSKRIFLQRYDETYQEVKQCPSSSVTLNVKLLNTSEIQSQDEDPPENNALTVIEWKSASVDASYNSLFYVPPGVLNIKGLETLKFSHNSFNEWNLQDFQKVAHTLQDLDLSHNFIKTVSISSYDILSEEDPPVAFDRLLYLKLNNNYLTTISEKFFGGFNNLLSLDLSNNMIFIPESLVFEGLVRVTSLDLSFNKIKNINLFLMRFSDLTELSLNNNDIIELQSHDFRSLSKLNMLTLSHNEISKIPNDVFNSMKHINTLDLGHNSITRIYKETFIKNSNLMNLDLSYNRINYIERGSFKNNSIDQLNLEGNQLEGNLQKGHFEGVSQIVSFNFSNQLLAQIDNFAFTDIPQLKHLNFSHNVLKLVSTLALKGLNALNILDLSCNNLMEVTFDASDLFQLSWLSLRNNNLSTVPANFIDKLISLEYLDFSENIIMHLEKYDLKMLQNLKYFNFIKNPLAGDLEEKTFHNFEFVPLLDLSQTSFTNVKNDSLYSMKELFCLNISHSNLTNVEYNAFTNIENLRIFDVSFNKLAVFFINNSRIRNLEELDLSNNLITHIGIETLSDFLKLQRLYFSHNRLKHIENNSFTTLNLQTLDVGFNKEANFNLEMLPKLSILIISGVNVSFDASVLQTHGIKLLELQIASAQISDFDHLNLSAIPSLVRLYLDSNEIASIGKMALRGLEMLKMLSLKFNKISTIEAGSFKDLESLEHLNASHNKISSLGYGVFKGLRNLVTLDLSYNKINHISIQRLYNLPRLNFLIIDDNQINDMNFKEFTVTRIKSLSLGGNKIPCSSLIDHKRRSKDYPPDSLLNLIALVPNHNAENVDGITCKGESLIQSSSDSEIKHTDVSLTQLIYNSQITNNILENIKEIMSDSKFTMNQSQLLAPNNGIDLSKLVMHNVSKLSQLLVEKIQQINIDNTSHKDKDIQKEIHNELKKENALLNNILKHFIDIVSQTNVTLKERDFEKELEQSLKKSATTNISEVEKLKEEFRQYVADEKYNIINELKSHFTDSFRNHEKSLFNDSSKTANFGGKQTSPNNITTSKFTEVSVGFILVIMLGCLAFKLYKSKIFFSNVRSGSTQEISNNIEMNRED